MGSWLRVLVALLALGVLVTGCSAHSAPSKVDAAAITSFAPDTCGLLSVTEASELLGSPATSQAFTDLGFPVSSHTARNPSYSQCRFTSESSQRQIRLIVNTDLAKAPRLSVQESVARVEPDDRALTIDHTTAVWLPWTQEDLRGQGGSLDSVKDGDYIAVVLIYVDRDPIRIAGDAMRSVLGRISSQH